MAYTTTQANTAVIIFMRDFIFLNNFLNTNTWKFLWHHSVKLKGKKEKKKETKICANM